MEAESTITATVTGNTESVAKLTVNVAFHGVRIDPVTGLPYGCSASASAESTFTITGDVPIVPTTAIFGYKPSLPGFAGKLTADEGCDSERTVHLFKIDAGTDTKLGTKTSAADGSYRFKGRAKRATYYVKAPKDNRGDLICATDKSSNVKVG